MKKIALCKICKVKLANYRATYCKKHYLVGNKNPMWKGDKVGYVPLHNWVIRKLGEPKKCEHCNKEDRKKYEWASVNHSYKRNIKYWIRLCTSCHRKYDYSLNK